MTVFWDAAACCLVEVYQSFRGACCLRRQGELVIEIKQALTLNRVFLTQLAIFWDVAPCSLIDTERRH
jgi:hypothetical protein